MDGKSQNPFIDTGDTEEQPSNSDQSTSANLNSTINTEGGAAVLGPVSVQDGDFVGRDQYKTIIAEEASYSVHGLPNPYPGLRAFIYADQSAFGGRDRAVQEAVAKLTQPGMQQTVLFITGASGSGKSSFAQAGLLPELEAHYQERRKQVFRAVFRPSSNPLAMLADALGLLELPDLSATELRYFTPEEFSRFLAEHTPNEQVNLLVIDQFEELFTPSAAGQRGILFGFLVGLASFEEIRTHILIVLRSDFLDELFDHRELWDIVKRGVELRAMNLEELKQAIQKPLWAACKGEKPDDRYCQKRFEATLLDRLAQDASQDATYLPLLQVTLQELWNGGSLTVGWYKTLTDAIRRRAEAVYQYEDFEVSQPAKERSPDDRKAILKILLDLVDVSLDNNTRRDVRHQRQKDELVTRDTRRASLVNSLISARLLSVSTELHGENSVEMIDIIHESLISNWDRLREAIAGHRQALQSRVRFEAALAEWSESGKSDEYKLVGVRLAEAKELSRNGDVALAKEEAKLFLERSIELNEAENKHQAKLEQRSRRGMMALGVVLVLFLIGLVWISYPYLLILFARGDLASIPAGNVIVGPDSTYGSPRGTQSFILSLNAFQIDKYEVTNYRYQLCILARRCSNPKQPLDLHNPEKSDYPVTGVSAIQAYEFCQWIGERLPSEIEWERAARGSDGRLWPWGPGDPNDKIANLNYGKPNELMKVGALPLGCTQMEHICDLIGNAAEWTASWKSSDNQYHPQEIWKGTKGPEDYSRFLVFRGYDYQTGWGASDPKFKLTMRSEIAPINESQETIGFRCAR